jgi:hypothetical protein
VDGCDTIRLDDEEPFIETDFGVEYNEEVNELAAAKDEEEGSLGVGAGFL